jgi:hypothetical protein
MSWLYSRALVEEFSEENCSGGEQSAPLKSTPTPQAYWSPDKTTDACPRFRSGMTCERLTDGRGEALLTSFRAGFHVKTSAPQEREQELTASDPGCGQKWRGSLAKYDLGSRTWKTRQCLLLGGLAEFSETWPRWGSMRNGESFRQPTPSGLEAIRQYITSAKESGLSRKMPTAKSREPGMSAKTSGRHVSKSTHLSTQVAILEDMIDMDTQCLKIPTLHGLSANQGQGGGEFDRAVRKVPTPQASDWKGPNNSGSGSQSANELATQVGGQLNPTWVEWLMGWPLEWTALHPSGMGRFRSWQQSHGEFLARVCIGD